MNATALPIKTQGVSKHDASMLSVMRIYLVVAKYELLSIVRTPGYAFPMLLLPIGLYLLIGVMLIGGKGMEDPNLPVYMFAAFTVFGVTGPGMFGFGMGLAVERTSGLLTLKRALPMPRGAHVIAKMLMSLACSGIVMCFLIPMATLFGHVSLNALQIVGIVLASMLGIATFCAIGLFIGSVASGSAAPGIVNLIYFPMMYLSGMFFPLPKILAPWALLWPTFYLDQLIIALGGGKNVIDPRLCIAVLVGLTIFFGGFAIQRLARRG